MDRSHPAGTTSTRGPRSSWALVAVVALLVGGVTGGLVATAAGRAGEAGAPGPGAPEPGSIEAVAAELAAGQAAESAALADELAAAAVTAHDRVEAVLAGLAVVAPPEGYEPSGGTPETDPAALAAEVEQARGLLAATGQGADDHGVTRAALVGALDLLGVAVESAALLPPDGTGPAGDREAVLARVSRDRDAAVELWQAGATRLDSLVVSTGGEHVHLFLTADGNPESVPLEFQELHQD